MQATTSVQKGRIALVGDSFLFSMRGMFSEGLPSMQMAPKAALKGKASKQNFCWQYFLGSCGRTISKGLQFGDKIMNS